MADECRSEVERPPEGRPAHRRWTGATTFTVVVVGLVTLALVDERSWWFTGSLLLIVAAAVAFFSLALPGSRFFAIALANSLAAYECVFYFFVEANFEGVGTPALILGFALPIVALCVVTGLRREFIRAVVAAEQARAEPGIAGALSWLVPVLAVGAATFALPGLDLGRPALDLVFLASMASIAAVVLLVGPTVAAFLIDTGLLFGAFFEESRRVVVAAFAFLTFYSVLVMIFAALYRTMDLMSPAPNFVVRGETSDISFAEALYFSVVTMATVGYGDITPFSDIARLVASVQVVTGVLLLLFGFSEIVSYTRGRGRDRGPG